MGCIQPLDQSSIEYTANTKAHHERCGTNPPPSESTPSLGRSTHGIIHYKPRSITIDIRSIETLMKEEHEPAINTNDLKNKMRKMMFTNSNSMQSMISNTATTHIPLTHSRMTSKCSNYSTIDADDSHYLYSNNISPNNSPITPATHFPGPTLSLDANNLCNTLILGTAQLNETNLNIMRSAPIFAYKKRTPSVPDINIRNAKPIKRSKSVDPDKNKHHSNKYAYTNHKNGKLNTTKNKRRLLHAKSKSIPHNIFSSDLNKYQNEETDTYQYLSQITHFDQNTLRLLHLRFNHIYIMSSPMDEDDSNEPKTPNTTHAHTTPKIKLDLAAISKIFGLPSHCLLVQRFFNYMDQHAMGELSFRVFARTMSVLSDKASIVEKCELSFSLYDLNNDNVIDNNELKQMIHDLIDSARQLMDPMLIKIINDKSNAFVDKLVQNTMQLFDLDDNGNITYKAYCAFMHKHSRLLSPFTLDVEKLLDFEAEKRRMNRISINSLKKKQLRQIVIGIDPKRKYNKKWKKPQFIKDMEKDSVQHVNCIKSPHEICQDLFDIHNIHHEFDSASNDSDVKEEEKQEKTKDNEREERLQRTIEFLYDD